MALSSGSEFKREALIAIRRIPAIRVAPYGDVNAVAGRPRISRVVGTIFLNCPALSVPCHRVVGACGHLDSSSKPFMSIELLPVEGVRFVGRLLRNLNLLR